MSRNNVVIIGLPQSGKTTFLAALWHIVTSNELSTALRFHSLEQGDYTHLNLIAKRWREAEPQRRTELRAPRNVQMNLADNDGREVRLSFPDLSGEAYRILWETRQCTVDVQTTIRSGGSLLLFIHSDKIRRPLWVAEERQQMAELGVAMPEDATNEQPWHPALSPTQVQLVDILQLIQEPPLNYSPTRIVVALSAWDTVIDEERRPDEFLRTELPLLFQYLQSVFGPDCVAAYGVSAQGDAIEEMTAETRPKAAALRSRDVASERIIVVDRDGQRSNDLTGFLKWLVC